MSANTSITYNGKTYVADSNGVLTEIVEGWNRSGTNYYYVQNGALIKNQVTRIDGKLYGFNYNGIMYSDCEFSSYSSSLSTYLHYRAMGSGALYENAWCQIDDNWYYYGAEGVAADGIQTINGKTYYFYYGRMYKNTTVTYNSESYIIDSNGIATKLVNGWNKIDGYYYYVEDGTIIKNQAKNINGSWYIFNYSGQMVDLNNGTYSIYSDGRQVYYRVKKGGKLYANEWYQNEYSGAWYYYGADAKPATGLTTVGSRQYYFYSDGEMAVNTVVSDDSDNAYKVDGNGYATKLGNGWNLIDGEYYYVESGKLIYGQLKTIGGKQYLFDYSGRMCADSIEAYNAVLYTAATNGAVTKITKDGLYKVDGEVFYLTGGKLFQNGWKKINNRYYYFSNYRAYTDTVSNIDGKYYFFSDEGIMAANGWAIRYSEKYYASASGALLTGEQKINNKWYYFTDTGVLRTGLVNYNGNYYLCRSDGSYIGRVSTINGWNQISGTWYYLENGNVVSGEKTINGKTYRFSSSMMLTNRTYNNTVLGSDGVKVQNGWALIDGSWYYVENGNYVTGEKKIGNFWYYFYQNGGMATGEVLVNGKNYVYDKNGHYLRTDGDRSKQDWVLSDGVYYYKDSKYTGWVGNYYVMDGRMLTNTVTPDGYYVGKDGKYNTKQGWVTVASTVSTNATSTYYAKSGGKLANNQWLEIGGSWYYFEGYGSVRGATHEENGKIYRFDISGKCLNPSGTAIKDGWMEITITSARKYWVYFRNGVKAEGMQYINGNLYYFDSYDGAMRTNSFASGSYSYRYFGSDGKAQNLTGWQKINNSWYFFNEDHVVEDSFINLDGVVYDCRPSMATGTVASRYLYNFNSSGALQSQETTQNGWQKKDGSWYYFKDGVLVSGLYTIDGKTYAFSGGRMMTDTIYHDYVYYEDDNGWSYSKSIGYYIGTDGTVSQQAGWHTRKNGSVTEQFYTDATGRVLTGIQKINGTTYYFNSNGILYK